MLDLNQKIKSVLISPTSRVNKKVNLWPPLVDFDEVIDLDYEIVVTFEEKYTVEVCLYTKKAVQFVNVAYNFEKTDKQKMCETVRQVISLFDEHNIKVISFDDVTNEENIVRGLIEWRKQIYN